MTKARDELAREERLKRQVEELREIDEVKKARQVAEVTESEYFAAYGGFKFIVGDSSRNQGNGI